MTTTQSKRVMDSDETVLGRGRYGTHASGYRAMLRAVRHWPERTWAIEGCQGIGGHIARRLIADGECVVDVPPRLSARTRVFTAGQGRKTDAHRRAFGRAGGRPDERAAHGRG